MAKTTSKKTRKKPTPAPASRTVTRPKRMPEASPWAIPVSQQTMWLLLKAAVILGAGIYVLSPTLWGNWGGDDDMYLLANPLLEDPHRIWKAWFEPGSFIEYYPLEETVQWVQWQLWGVHDGPAGYLATNVILHLISALLVWRLFSKLGLKLAWVGGLIYAIHPLLIDSVGVSSELKNTLSLPPFLLAMCFYLDFDKSGKPRDYLWSLSLFLIAMLCKVSMAFFPFMIPLYAWWKRDRVAWRDIKLALPFFVISLVLGYTTVHAGEVYAKATHYVSPNTIHLGGLLNRTELVGQSFMFYIGKCFLPIYHMPLYPLWNLEPVTAWSLIPWLGIVAILITCWWKRHSWGRTALFGLGFFTMAIAPFLGLNEVSYMCLTWVQDHFVYIPLLGLIGLFVAAIEHIGQLLPRKFLAVGIAALVIALGLLGAQARFYSALFADKEALWRYNLAYSPDAWLTRYGLANLLAQKGDMYGAVAQMKESIRANPNFSNSQYQLGLMLWNVGDHTGALDCFRKVIQINPTIDSAYFNLATALVQTKRTPEAVEVMTGFVHDQPDSAQGHSLLGNILAQDNRIPEAITQYQKALQLDPSDQNSRIHLEQLQNPVEDPLNPPDKK